MEPAISVDSLTEQEKKTVQDITAFLNARGLQVTQGQECYGGHAAALQAIGNKDETRSVNRVLHNTGTIIRTVGMSRTLRVEPQFLGTVVFGIDAPQTHGAWMLYPRDSQEKELPYTPIYVEIRPGKKESTP